MFKLKIKILYHAVSRTQQRRQRNPSVKTHFFHRILEVSRVEWRNSIPRFVSTPEPRNENINLNNFFYFLGWGSQPQPVDFALCPCATTGFLLCVHIFFTNITLKFMTIKKILKFSTRLLIA